MALGYVQPVLWLLRQAFRVLSRNERFRLAGVIGLIFIGMVLESFSISLIIPVVTLISGGGELGGVAADVAERLSIESREDLLRASLIAFVCVYVVRSLFTIWSLWVQSRFSTDVAVRLGERLVRKYLGREYEYHLNVNSARLIRNTQNADVFMTGVIDPFLVLLTDGSVALALVGLLLVVEPAGTMLVMAVFLACSALFISATRRRTSQWGAEKNHHGERMIVHLQQAFGGVKDAKLMDLEETFLGRFVGHLRANARITRKYSVVVSLPRLWIEVLTAVCLSLVVFVMLARSNSLSQITVVIGLLAGVAFRILPSVSRINTSIQTLGFSRGIVSELLEDVLQDDPTTEDRDNETPLLGEVELHGINFRYRGSEKLVLRGVDLRIERGSFVGIIGESGSGKSTLVDVLIGLLRPVSGRILVGGVDVTHGPRAWRSQIGYVPQHIYITDESILANVAFGVPLESIDRCRVNQVIRLAKLDKFVESLPEGVDQIVGERGARLSGGQRQRLGIARALYRGPSILVLDEATSALDGLTEAEIMSEVVGLVPDVTLIAVAHRMTTLARCSEIYRMEEGIIIREHG